MTDDELTPDDRAEVEAFKQYLALRTFWRSASAGLKANPTNAELAAEERHARAAWQTAAQAHGRAAR